MHILKQARKKVKNEYRNKVIAGSLIFTSLFVVSGAVAFLYGIGVWAASGGSLGGAVTLGIMA